MEVQLVSPEQVLYVGEADMVIARTLGGGEIAFLKGHAPFLIKQGALADPRIAPDDKRRPRAGPGTAEHVGDSRDLPVAADRHRTSPALHATIVTDAATHQAMTVSPGKRIPAATKSPYGRGGPDPSGKVN